MRGFLTRPELVIPQLQCRSISFSMWLPGVFSVLSNLTRSCVFAGEIPAMKPFSELRMTEKLNWTPQPFDAK